MMVDPMCMIIQNLRYFLTAVTLTAVTPTAIAPTAQLFQSSKLIMDIATYRLNQPRANAVKII